MPNDKCKKGGGSIEPRMAQHLFRLGIGALLKGGQEMKALRLARPEVEALNRIQERIVERYQQAKQSTDQWADASIRKDEVTNSAVCLTSALHHS